MNIEQFKVCCFTWNFVFLVKGMLHETFYQFCHVQRQRRLVLKIVQTFLSSWHSIMRKNECTSNFFVKCKCNFFFTGWWREKGVLKVQGAWKVYDLFSVFSDMIMPKCQQQFLSFDSWTYFNCTFDFLLFWQGKIIFRTNSNMFSHFE